MNQHEHYSSRQYYPSRNESPKQTTRNQCVIQSQIILTITYDYNNHCATPHSDRLAANHNNHESTGKVIE